MQTRGEMLEGLPVADSKISRTIKVRQSDITKRGVKDPSSCAIAEACKRSLGVAEARIYLTRAYLKKGKRWVRFHVPARIRQEIVSFDRGGTFTAGEYELKAIPPSHTLPALRARTAKSKKGSGEGAARKHIRPYHATVGVRTRAPL